VRVCDLFDFLSEYCFHRWRRLDSHWVQFDFYRDTVWSLECTLRYLHLAHRGEITVITTNGGLQFVSGFRLRFHGVRHALVTWGFSPEH